MKQVITKVKDTQAFMLELEEKFPSYVVTDEGGDKTWTIFHTPIVKNESGSLALSMMEDSEFDFMQELTTIESLGTYEEIFNSPVLDAKYKEIYPYDIPQYYKNEKDEEIEYFRPQKIGEFAL